VVVVGLRLAAPVERIGAVVAGARLRLGEPVEHRLARVEGGERARRARHDELRQRQPQAHRLGARARHAALGIDEQGAARHLVDQLRPACGARHRRHGDDAVHPLRMAHRPLQRLHAAHRCAADGGQAADAEAVEQAPLRLDHVADRDAREVGTGLGCAVGRRRRQAVAERIDDDDAAPLGVEGEARADQEVEPVVRAADRGREQHRRLAQARLVAVHDIGDEGVAQRRAGFERQVAELEAAVRPVDPAGLQGRVPGHRVRWLRERRSRESGAARSSRDEDRARAR
jgi:hypothetical protein